ncbi:MAG: YdcF family protein [Anaerolineales bacterium]|uniref:SanA/YdcF family protein n=1 Tax=Candidatus Villigracilis proximus TaxID=3140683 RepID=UPI003135E8E9|nr:YdcF family protein [Anaerolineales bacterium]MBK9210224.1 YdcF family protein [Anaerolineales bacterium]
MFKKIFKFLWRFALILSLLVLTGLLLPKLIVLLYAMPRTFAVLDVPAERVAIVFGAGLLRDGSAGPVLRDRVETAVQLYQQSKVDKLLMSGDNRFVEYNEPEAMRQYALDLGVPDEDIVLDYAGRRTYDTCYRAKHIFQVDSAILVTQAFHLPRALFLCNWFGIESTGVEADNHYFLKRSRIYWNTRELFANFQAVWDVMIAKPLPVLGEPEPIE